MTTTALRAATWRHPRRSDPDNGRNNARAGGIFYLLTFAASIPPLPARHRS